MVDGEDGVIRAWHRSDDAGPGRHPGAQPFNAGNQPVGIPVVAGDVVIIGRGDDFHPHRIGVRCNAAKKGVARVAMGIDQARNEKLSPAVDNRLITVAVVKFIHSADVDNPVAFYRQCPVLNNTPLLVDRNDRSVPQQKACHILSSLA